MDQELKEALKGVGSELASLGLGMLGLGMEALLHAGAGAVDRMQAAAAERAAAAEAAAEAEAEAAAG
jgi:hypothetical protein